MCAGHTKRALGRGFINWGTHMQIEFLNELAVCKHKGAFKPLRIRTWPIKSAEQTQLAGKQTVSNIQNCKGNRKMNEKSAASVMRSLSLQSVTPDDHGRRWVK